MAEQEHEYRGGVDEATQPFGEAAVQDERQVWRGFYGQAMAVREAACALEAALDRDHDLEVLFCESVLRCASELLDQQLELLVRFFGYRGYHVRDALEAKPSVSALRDRVRGLLHRVRSARRNMPILPITELPVARALRRSGTADRG